MGEKEWSNILEREFQANLILEIKERFEGSMVLKNDSSYLQGVPDLMILYKDKWATLEVKKNKTAKRRPNQKYYVETMNNMSFSAMIYPENKEEILDEMERTFRETR